MKNFPVTFLMLFAFELWFSEAGPLFSLTSSKNVPSPGANTNWPILDVIVSTFRRKISEQDTILENNLGNVTNSLESINNAVDKMDRSLSDLVETTQEFYHSFPSLMLNMTELVMNKLDKLLPCDKQLVEPINAQASWNAAEDRVTITCNEGFITESQASEQPVECLRGRWTAYEPCKRICPDAFVSEGDICLRLVPKALNWENAKWNCAQMGHGATLAMLKTASEARSFKDFLVNNHVSNAHRYLWLGATRGADDGGNWYWLDDFPVVLSDELNWHMGEPNGAYNLEDCLDFNTKNLGLYDNRCDRESPSICEIPRLRS